MRKEIESQIRKATQMFALHNISMATNFPKWEEHDLVWERFQNLSFSLKNEKYHTLYKECLRAGDYNLVMIDGAILQMRYRFYKEIVTEHVLIYLPNPYVEKFQEDLPGYMAEYFSGHDLFSEVANEEIICCPMRFDFNCEKKFWRDVDHPYSHLTIGNYKHCRIPVTSPISPNRFMKFILRNFYHEMFKQFLSDGFFTCPLKFADTISEKEKNQLHFGWLPDLVMV